ncbi:thiosulfate oxidation carrier complex protein SoxZ [Methylovorus sp. MM2]|uniref:thiosulfate oxidation carrier complex protein SoxZ n=1 Tax=Methylovorus sp. MM2 TaxID=1848038 RepID=UPI0007DF3475|nr:thiosulfate oxidation carrier complex protein SoxZ [Methylovorus sp. MM2]OAM51774.1 thiosulfate oxidation carrier complex protein SoxZ [Methylovorus sp. MM2]
MANDIKLRAQLNDDITEIKVLMSHPMETGRRKNGAGEIVPAHFIQLVTMLLNDKTVLEAEWGTGIAKDPYLTFHLKGAKIGDKIVIVWHDNQGNTGNSQIFVV